MNEWLPVKEAGELLRISRRQVINRIHRGKLRAMKDGRIWLVHSSLSEELEVTEETSEEASKVTGEASEETHRKLEEMVGYLKAQIEEKDSQIAELQADNRYLREELRKKDQAVAVAQNTAQQLLERLQTPFWKRWFRRQRALPQGDVMDMEVENENQP